MSYPKKQIDQKQRERERERESHRGKKSERADFALVLTGRRQQRRFLVYVWGKPVWLSGGLLEVLADLVAAAAESGASNVPAPALVIHRLRHAIDGALGRPGAGARLIATVGDRYRLAVPRAAVALDATFAELADSVLLGPEQVALLSRRCRRLKSI